MAERSIDDRERYVGYATHCLQLAKVATDRKSRVALKEMAAKGLKLADAPVDGASVVRNRNRRLGIVHGKSQLMRIWKTPRPGARGSAHCAFAFIRRGGIDVRCVYGAIGVSGVTAFVFACLVASWGE